MIVTSCDINLFVSPKKQWPHARQGTGSQAESKHTMRGVSWLGKPPWQWNHGTSASSAHTTGLIHARRGGVPRTGRMALWPTRCLTYNQRAPIFGRPQSKRHAEHKKAHNTLAYRQQTSTPVEHHRPPAQMRPFPSWQARYARASVTPLVTQIAETRVPCWGSAPCNTSRCNREM